jgi:hypothetical protein
VQDKIVGYYSRKDSRKETCAGSDVLLRAEVNPDGLSVADAHGMWSLPLKQMTCLT